MPLVVFLVNQAEVIESVKLIVMQQQKIVGISLVDFLHYKFYKQRL